MSDKRGNVKIMRPGKGDTISVRRLSPTKEEREKDQKAFHEQKERQQKVKEERFAAIRERRKKKDGDPSGGSGGGINIEVTSDS
jgi:hypothetical protein